MSTPSMTSLDHLVLTVRDLGATTLYYTWALVMHVEWFGVGRHALKFGSRKINLHQAGREFEPRVQSPAPGLADLCFLTDVSLDESLMHLAACGVAIIEGPMPQTGATVLLESID